MIMRTLFWLLLSRLISPALATVMVTAAVNDVLAQTYGAQQSVRRSLDRLGRPAPEAGQDAGAANARPVSYQRDVLPILRANCHGCHGPDKVSGGLEMTTFDSLLQGGESGSPAVVPGDPDSSYLVQMITPVDGEAAMPQNKRPLAASQIALVRRWIEQGASDDSQAGITRNPYGGEPRSQPYGEARSEPYGSGPTPGMIDTTYVSPTAVAVAAIRPAQLLSAPAAELLPTEVFTAAGLQYLGFEPMSVEEVVAYFGPPNIAGPTEYGVAIKFSSPFRAATINRAIRAHAQLSEFAGKRYLQSPHPALPSFFGPDNRTLVIAPDATLRRLVQSKDQPKTGPMLERLASVAAGSDLYLTVDLASLRPFVEMGLAPAKASGKIPPHAQKFLDLPKLISALELTFNISASGPISLVLHANDEAAAEKLETVLLETTNQGAASPNATTAPTARYGSYGTGAEDPVAQSVTQFVERFWRPFRPQRNGTSVTLLQVDAQSQAQQQLASLAVFGIGVGVQAAQAAQVARTAAPAADEGFVAPAETVESAELPSR
jgi:mono/diheme cytochrome c family protein